MTSGAISPKNPVILPLLDSPLTSATLPGMKLALVESLISILYPKLESTLETVDFISVKFAELWQIIPANFLTCLVLLADFSSIYRTSPISKIFCGRSSCLLSSKNSIKLLRRLVLIIVPLMVIGLET